MKMIRWLPVMLCLLLTGCSWMDGNFHSVTVHEAHIQSSGSDEVSAANYPELVTSLENMISEGREKGVIYVGEYNQNMIISGIATAVRNTLKNMPLAAYAVDEIRYELGNTGGKPAIALEITYLHGRAEILQIRHAEDMETAKAAIAEALTEYRPGIVLLIDQYDPLDISQLVEDYAEENPQLIMEIPQVASGTYPEEGTSRILELKFSYRNSREDLREMKEYVSSMFNAAALYVNSDDSDTQKLSHLYSFLMERFDYHLETSITPSYSLLRHGVGDSKAFSAVYAAMCRQVGLECHMVTGTRNGEPWYWNIVRDGENYYHVDLLECSKSGEFSQRSNADMAGYVWDYSRYPDCAEPVLPQGTVSENPTPSGQIPGEETTDSTEENTDPTEEERGTDPTRDSPGDPTEPSETSENPS